MQEKFLPEGLMKNIFYKVGDIPRYVLQGALVGFLRNQTNWGAAENNSCKCMKDAIDNVKDVSALF